MVRKAHGIDGGGMHGHDRCVPDQQKVACHRLPPATRAEYPRVARLSERTTARQGEEGQLRCRLSRKSYRSLEAKKRDGWRSIVRYGRVCYPGSKTWDRHGTKLHPFGPNLHHATGDLQK